jgi:dolichyl-phosphate-mannose--protein O-mannosyl transferase/Gpi18-like mannosyltransferase
VGERSNVSTSKAELRSSVRVQERSAAGTLWLWVLLACGFLLRLVFMGSNGFANDVSSFEAWAITLATHPFSQFYASTSFADYPPGYFYFLWVVGHLYGAIAPHGNLDVLKYLVKLPAVLMDLADGAILYALVRRFANERWALAAAALFVLNPAVIFISAAWGQVDSISGGLALLAMYLLVRSGGGVALRQAQGDTVTTDVVIAWVLLAFSLLIKPQAAILVPLFIAYAFAAPEVRKHRLLATGAGIVAACLFVFALTVPFHPTANPVDAYSWLYGKYTFAKNVYAYNSVNAFNLWSVLHGFWTPDSQQIGPWPQYFWGVLLVAAATVLTIVRYMQSRTQQAFIESAALLGLAFYMLATRMHERYIYDGFLFTIASIPFATRYLWAAVVFTFTLFVNLFYSLTYLTVVTQHTPGVNAADMWPWITHPLSLLNIATFFFLGYVFLGQNSDEPTAAQSEIALAARGARTQEAPSFPIRWRGRAWFNPREGLGSMVWPLDYMAAGLLGFASFIVSYVNYWLPNEKIFDEIYFARAAEEYLTNKYIYENTHPPLTKLIITLSTMMFGGMPAGDNPHGWRFLDVVFGAIVIVVLYAFAKRMTRSTLFASFAALMFIADGMHFVQSRIATPEGIVVVFSLGTLYAFYRYWIASQSSVRAYEPSTIRRAVISLIGALILGFICGAIVNVLFAGSHASFIVAGLYFTSGWYMVMRRWIVPRFMKPEGEIASYADGSVLIKQNGQTLFETPDGRSVKKDIVQRDEDATITYKRDGSVQYATPAGSATYAPGIVADDQGEVEEGRHATGWLVAFTLLLGALVASKWYGVMAYGVSFVVILAVWLQRYWREGKTKLWGNPLGFRLDLAIAAIIFLSMTVYVCVWIPDFFRHIEIKNLSDLIYRQYSMFEYHDTLKATHPYQSSWWQWPLDLRPIAYYWKDLRNGVFANSPSACCVAEIISLPNPLILWFGLICVPAVAYLAWREKNKGYALLIIAYLLQWLPWARSPRITFAYHFYVDIPLIILCNVIILQRIWNWEPQDLEKRYLGRICVGGYVAAVVLAFIWFYPILAGVPLPWDQWNARMWLGSHWV